MAFPSTRLFVIFAVVICTGVVRATLPTPPSYVFSISGEICVYNSSSPVLDEAQMTCLVKYFTTSPFYLEMNLAENLIYFSHVDDIYMIPYEEGAKETAIMFSAGTVSDLSFDWLSGNLYFVDQSLGAVRVMTSHGDHTVTLIRDVSWIRTVKVDPINRYLFWIKQERLPNGQFSDSMGRSRLDGSERNDNFYTNMDDPVYIALDHQQRRIYWTDRLRGSIESIDFEGQDHRVLFEDDDKRPYNLAIDQDYVVWLDDTIHYPSVVWTNKSSGSHSQVDTHERFFTLVNDILVYGAYSQPIGYTNGCSDNNGGCSHLCFAVSDTDRKCVCSMGFVLADDDTSCVAAPRGELKDNIVIADAARGGIYFLNTDTEGLSALDIPRQSNIESVAVDGDNGYVFWANIEQETIERARLDGSDVTVIKTFEQGHTIVALAVDPADELIFYCDIQAYRTSSLSYSGATETLLLPENNTVAIVPDIVTKQVYVAVSGYVSYISRVSYDGSRATTLIDDIWRPLSLAIDFEKGRMYWVQSHVISFFEWSDLDGGNRQTAIIGWYSAFLSMSILGDFVYIADWASSENQVGRVEKGHPSEFEVFGPDDFLHVTKIVSVTTANRSISDTTTSTSTQSTTTMPSTTLSSTTTTTTTTPSTTLSSTTSTTPSTTQSSTTTTTTTPSTTISSTTTMPSTTQSSTTPTTTPSTTQSSTTTTTTPSTTQSSTTTTTTPSASTTSISSISKTTTSSNRPSTAQRSTTAPYTTRTFTSLQSSTVLATASVAFPRGSSTVGVSGAKAQSGDNAGTDNMALIAGVSVGVVVVIIVIVTITVCVLRNRRTLPPSDMVINNMAFENPEYADLAAHSVTSPSVYAAAGAGPLPVKKASIFGSSRFPVSYHDDKRSISGYSKFHGSFRDDASTVSGLSNSSRSFHGDTRSHRGSDSGSHYGGSYHGNDRNAWGGSQYAPSVHGNRSAGGGSVYGRSNSGLYESLPGGYK